MLVHAGAGGAGSAALQLGVHAGARVFATAGSPEKTKLCLELGAELAINYRETDFAEAVLDATDGRGVDVAFDAVSGDVTLKTFRCMAFNGRHILAGFASGIEQEDEGLVPRPVLFGNFSLVGVCHAYVDDPVVFKRLSGFNFPAHRDGEQLHAELLALFAAGKLRAIVGQEVPFRRASGRARRNGATPDRRPHRRQAVVVGSVRGLPEPEVREVAPFAWRPVLLIAGAVVVLLVAVSSRYGWHRDELYFRAAGEHLAWGYVDQPPFTPFVARMAAAVSADNLAVLRLLPALTTAVTIALGGLIAREFGGLGRRRSPVPPRWLRVASPSASVISCRPRCSISPRGWRCCG